MGIRSLTAVVVASLMTLSATPTMATTIFTSETNCAIVPVGTVSLACDAKSRAKILGFGGLADSYYTYKLEHKRKHLSKASVPAAMTASDIIGMGFTPVPFVDKDNIIGYTDPADPEGSVHFDASMTASDIIGMGFTPVPFVDKDNIIGYTDPKAKNLGSVIFL